MATQSFRPLLVDGPGILLIEVPFIGYASYWDNPGAEVLQTVLPYRVEGDTVEDRNAASQAGIRFEPHDGTPDSTGQTCPGLTGVTLRVHVDLGELEPDSWNDEVVALTLKCGILNARRRWPRVRWLEYSVEGNPAYGAFAGVYSLEAVDLPHGPVQDLRGLSPASKQ
jgi:hypothetical protein